MNFITNILENVRTKTPLVHNITNYVTVNDCANMVLACGGSPIMADDSLEVEDITSICNALVINIGTLNSRTIESMILSGKKANELNIPVILDPVGAGASKLRTETTNRLLREIKFSVIRGNISEIKSIAVGSTSTIGVDANEMDKISEENLCEGVKFAKDLAKSTDAVIAITGPIDIVTDSTTTYIIRNGHVKMGYITGTGCMLTSIIGAFCGANPDDILKATAAAVSAMGLCGELAYKKVEERNEGTGSLKVYLIDYMSSIDRKALEEGIRIEIK